MGITKMSIPGPKVTFSIIDNTGSVSDGMGGIRESWAVSFTVTDGVYSTERLGNVEERREGKEVVITYHVFYCKYSAGNITEEMRVRYDGVDYDIVKLNNPAGVDNHWEIKTREIETEF